MSRDALASPDLICLVGTPAEDLRHGGLVFDLELPHARAIRRRQRVLAQDPAVLSSPHPLADDHVVDRRFTRCFDHDGR